MPTSSESSGRVDAGAGGAAVRHSERLYLAWWGWPLPLVAAALIAASIHLGYPGVRAWLPYLITTALAIAVILQLSRTTIRIVGSKPDGELRVADARLPLRFVGKVDVVGKKDKRQALGPGLDPAAYLVHRGWVGSLVRVWLEDPDDPTPYWLFSTRHPERIAELLRADT